MASPPTFDGLQTELTGHRGDTPLDSPMSSSSYLSDMGMPPALDLPQSAYLEKIQSANASKLKAGQPPTVEDWMPPQTAMSLHLAVSKDDAFTAAMLILEGADVNRFHLTSGCTPLDIAVDKGNLPMAKMLRAKGAKLDGYQLEIAVNRKHTELEAWLRQEMLAHLLEGSSGGEDESEDGADDVTDLLNEEDDDDSDDEEELQRPRWYSES